MVSFEYQTILKVDPVLARQEDDEKFYIPYGNKIADVSSQFNLAYAWIKYYNTKRPHYGKELSGKTPFECLKSIMAEVDPCISLFLPVFLAEITTDSTWRGSKTMCVNAYIFS